MAKGKGKKRRSKKRGKKATMFGPRISKRLLAKRHKDAKGKVPIEILEKRLRKLNGIVVSRGGAGFYGR